MIKGMVHIYWGKGKGKTTSSIGLIIRALAYQKKIGLIKFFKQENCSGEDHVLAKFKKVSIWYSKYKYPGFIKNDGSYRKKSCQDQKRLFNKAMLLSKKKYDILVLDEILDLIPEKIINTEDLIALIKQRWPSMELILTGHYIDKQLSKTADLITEMRNIKHFFNKKIGSREGVEY